MIEGSEHDLSNGFDAIAEEFIKARQSSRVGESEVRAWARQLPSSATVLDLGCGNGVPVSQCLVEEGLEVYGIDASPRMVHEYRRRFPRSRVACEAVEKSSFFDLTFDGVVAWGLLFLLPADEQIELIHKMGAIVKTSGRVLFTSPSQVCSWADVQTGRLSLSLGSAMYIDVLRSAGLALANELSDSGQNHYYDAVKL
jgi:2-polyprenyl-3-methyl-5-hydroxy-6-metoxy-1,4-benzoquinol methylase